jgi:hypothetical protein
MEIPNTIFRRADKVNPNQKVLIDGDMYTRDPTYHSGFTQRFVDCKHPRCVRLISNKSFVLEIIPTIEYANRKIKHYV